MNLKEFDKLEEKIGQMLKSLAQFKEENQRLKKELQTFQEDSSHKDLERNEIKKKVHSLIELLDSMAPHE